MRYTCKSMVSEIKSRMASGWYFPSLSYDTVEIAGPVNARYRMMLKCLLDFLPEREPVVLMVDMDLNVDKNCFKEAGYGVMHTSIDKAALCIRDTLPAIILVSDAAVACLPDPLGIACVVQVTTSGVPAVGVDHCLTAEQIPGWLPSIIRNVQLRNHSFVYNRGYQRLFNMVEQNREVAMGYCMWPHGGSPDPTKPPLYAFVNSTWERMFHHGAGAVIGKPVLGGKLIENTRNPEGLEQHMFQDVMANEFSVTDLWYLRDDDSWFYGRSSIYNAFSASKELLVAAFSTSDITPLKEARDKLAVQNRELEQSNRLKDEFLSNTTHELRTPLNGILGLSEAIASDVAEMAGIEPTVQKRCVYSASLIVKSARRLSNTINAILRMAKLQNGEVQVMQAQTALVQIVDVSLDNLELGKLDPAKLVVENKVPHGLMASVDTGLLIEVLSKLLDNAIKFGSSERKNLVQILGTSTDTTVELRIVDTGIGIPDADRAKVFDMFTQGNGTATREREGCGLGLVIASKIVQLHGGKLGIETSSPTGTTMLLQLPVDSSVKLPATPRVDVAIGTPLTNTATPIPVEAQGIESMCKDREMDCSSSNPNVLLPLSSPAKANGKPVILSVDDDEINQQVIASILRDRDIELLTAMNGREALNVLEQRPDVQLVLLDIMMPIMDGMTVCRHVRSANARRPSIIMVSAKNGASDISQALGAGANDYVTKPFNKVELLARIDSQLRINEVVQQTVAINAEPSGSSNGAAQVQESLQATSQLLQELKAECRQLHLENVRLHTVILKSQAPTTADRTQRSGQQVGQQAWAKTGLAPTIKLPWSSMEQLFRLLCLPLEYCATLQAHHITLELLPMLSSADLAHLGVQAYGHRLKLLNALAPYK